MAKTATRKTKAAARLLRRRVELPEGECSDKKQKPRGLLPPGLPSSWLRGQDLNLRPSGYEPDELPGCSTARGHLNHARSRRASLSATRARKRASDVPFLPSDSRVARLQPHGRGVRGPEIVVVNAQRQQGVSSPPPKRAEPFSAPMEGGAHVARASTPRAHSLGARPSTPRLGSGVPSAVSRAARTAAARRQGPSPAGKSVRDRRMVGRMRAYPLVVVTFSTLVMACAGQALPGPRADIAARSYRMPESTRSRWRRDGRHLRLGHGQSDGGAERVCLRGVAHGAFRGPSPVRARGS